MEALELFEPAEYIDIGGPGQFTLAGLPGGKWYEKNYPVEHLHTVIEGANPNIDTYISQATFAGPRRRIQTVEQISVLFVDLDTYNVPELRGLRPAEQCSRVLAYCDSEGIPAPSYVLFSGRGLYTKWLLSEPTRSESLPEWHRIERRLVELMGHMGADPSAKDAARVLRLDRTVNTKSGERARVLHVTGGNVGCPARYAIDQLWEQIKPEERITTRRRKGDQPRTGKVISLAARQGFTWQSLAWARHEDLRKIWKLRGGCPVGRRETTLFWRITFLMQADLCALDRFYAEAIEIARDIWGAETGWYREADLSTVYRKAKAARAGETVIIGGRETTPLYTPSNARLITDFRITPDEMRELSTLIDSSEKYRRKVETRREAGVKEQPYRNTRPWEALGISRRWFYKLRKRGVIPKPEDKAQDKGQSVHSPPFEPIHGQAQTRVEPDLSQNLHADPISSGGSDD